MKKLFLLIIGLIALFTVIRVQSEEVSSSVLIHPGCIEFGGKNANVRLNFGFIDLINGKDREWSILPLSLSVVSGKTSLRIGFSGLEFLTRSGVTIGKKIIIRGEREGDVISLGGEVDISGKVKGDVWTLGANIVLKKGARITGNAVAIGGRIKQARGSIIGGNKESLPQVKIPLLGLFTSRNSAVKIRLIVEIGRTLLFLLILFLFVHFSFNSARGISSVVLRSWKDNLLYFLLLLVVVPLITGLFILSVSGILFLPLLALLLISMLYIGFLVVVIRLGLFFFGEGASQGRLYLAGLVGYFLVEIPFFIGLPLSTANGEVLQAIATVLKLITTVLWFAFAFYGSGAILGYLRVRNKDES